jgi:hypothetical protein
MSVISPAFDANGVGGRQHLGDVLVVASSETSFIKAISQDSGLSLSLESPESDSGIKLSTEFSLNNSSII